MGSIKKTGSLSVLSLFSGCGGMDLGLEGDFDVHKKCVNTTIHPDWIKKDYGNGWVRLKKTPFTTIFANDIRPDAKVAWEHFFMSRGKKNNVFHLDSIVDLVKNYKNNGKNIFPNKPDIVTGGFPCQDFSLAGKRLGFNSKKSHNGEFLSSTDEPTFENRGRLYMWMRDVIEITKPKMFIAENVKGLITLGDVKNIIENDFARIGGGYIVKARVVCTADYGVPQNRERIFFIGFNKNELTPNAIAGLESSGGNYDPFPTQTHSAPGYRSFMGDLMPYVTVRDVLNDLPEPEFATDPAQLNYSKAKYLPKGQGNSEVKIDAPSPTIRAEHHGNIEFRRLSKEHGGRHVHELDAGLKERRLTVRECARLQTFPDDYAFIIDEQKENAYVRLSGSNSYKLIGNAVPPLMAYNIAMRLVELWPNAFQKRL